MTPRYRIGFDIGGTFTDSFCSIPNAMKSGCTNA